MASQYPGLLGLANIILLIASTSLMYLGAALTNFYLLDKLDFISVYFSVVPHIMIGTGVASFFTALIGCFVAVQKSRWQLWTYSFFMVVLFCCQLAGIFSAMELRSVINNSEFAGINVLDDLKDYKTNPDTRTKWDSLHREFHCCGGLNFNTGYKIWSNADIGLTSNSVPDSCCQRMTQGCGTGLLTRQDIYLTQTIHTHGCLTVMEEKLSNQVVPILLGYAGCGTILALLQLLAIVFACAYSAALSRKAKKEEDLRSMYQSSSIPSTPRFDHVRGMQHYGKENMTLVYDPELTLERKRAMMESPVHPEEREV